MSGAVRDGLVLTDEARDGRVRWAPGERFHHLVEAAVDAHVAAGRPDHPAIELPDGTVAVTGLDARANRLARHLRAHGVGAGDRVGLLLDRSEHPLVAMLAVSKLHAAYVPLDAAFPAGRMTHICADAGVGVVLTRPHLAALLDDVVTDTGVRLAMADGPDGPAGDLPDDRLSPDEVGAAGRRDPRAGAGDRAGGVPGDGGTVPSDDVAYVIYTSGTTGRPKGVPIEHAAFCNFLRVAAEHYGYGPDDRVYQGMTIAFDFSVEETWVPLLAGACLIPGPPGGALVGAELATFLRERRITAMCCVPTLLATLEDDLPDLRFLLVSGEACPQDLVARWWRPDRRMLNVYGPTETTVTCTWTTLRPDEPVTIGVPLPTYRAVVLDPDDGRPQPFGATGELAIAGVGLSPGYLGRDDLTAKAFVPDPLDLPDNPSGRLYRTGDLCRIDEEGRIVYLGRIDAQVKIRGYRVELAEIESVLMEAPGVAQAAVVTHEPEPGLVELAGFVTAADPAHAPDPGAVLGGLRERVPAYMVPAYLEPLERLPTLPSGKVDRSALPAPSGPRHVATRGAHVPPADEDEAALADALADALDLERVSVTADVFADLGADSLRVARFCARARRRPSLAGLATQDVYLHPTVRALAGHLRAVAAPGRDAATIGPHDRAARAPHVAGRAAHVACGAAQGACYLAYLLVLGTLITWGAGQLDGVDLLTGWLRSLGLVGAGLLALTLLPVLLKWTLIGRFDSEPIPVWSARYLRFWVVRTAVGLSPTLLLRGSPLHALYLRALGVRVGAGALILTRRVPVCADLMTIGAGTVVREDAAISGYRVEGGWILPGPVRIGADAVIGEGSLVDVHTRIGDGAQLAHASSLAEGSEIPAGRRWHGSPAVDAGPAPAPWHERTVSRRRRAAFAAGQAVALVAVRAQLAVAGVALVVALDVAHPLRAAAVCAGLLLAHLTVRLGVSRLTSRVLVPGRTYPLYGWRWALLQATVRTSNSPFLNALFGDSSAIVHYLRAVGVRFRNPVQTGSNFGLRQRLDVPQLCEIGGGSIVSDDLAIFNADHTGHAFRVGEVRIGERVFIGNEVVYPAGATVGDDCLLASRVMVPVDGPVRTGVGLLGSPAFEIPRTVSRDAVVAEAFRGEALRRGLRGKNRHNAGTMGLFLLARVAVVLIGVGAVDTVGRRGAVGMAAALLITILGGLAVLIASDAAARGFRRLRPRHCSIYDPRFWRHERYWKLNDVLLLNLLDGTPFKALLWRAMGVRVGRRLFDDGATMPECSLVTLGDDVTLGAHAVLHGHSLEDGAFKCDAIRLGSRCTVGPGAMVHYGTAVGDEAVVAPDSFVMKGERLDPGTRWRGNPARRMPDAAAEDAAVGVRVVVGV